MRASFAVASCSRPVGAPMTEDEAGLALAEALKTVIWSSVLTYCTRPVRRN
jgi:hypothetical protein